MRAGPPRLRLAPQPWGTIHLGGLRVALVNHAFCRATAGALLLRMDDTAPHPGERAFERELRAILERFGVPVRDPAEARGRPFRQSDRHAVYRERALSLVASGKAYRCVCPPRRAGDSTPRVGACACACAAAAEASDSAAARRLAVIRLRTDPDRVYRYRDLIHGEVAGRLPRDPPLVRSDGRGLYAFASVVDDVELGITHVIRGEDHRDATLAQVAMFEALGEPLPRFAHVSLVLDEDGRKLSKSRWHPAVADLLRQGLLPGAIASALRASGPPGWWEALAAARSVEDAERALARLGRRPTHVSRDALGRAQRRALRALGWEAAAAHLRAWVHETGLLTEDERGPGPEPPDLFADRQVVEALIARSRRMGAVLRQVLAWRLPPSGRHLPPRARAFARRLLRLREREGADAPWVDSIGAAAAAHEVPRAAAMTWVRRAWTGRAEGPPITLTARALGEARCLRRLRAATGRPRRRARQRAVARVDERQVGRYLARQRGLRGARVVRAHRARRGPVFELEARPTGDRYFVKGFGEGPELEALVVEERCLELLGPRGLSASEPVLDLGRRVLPFPVLSYRALAGAPLGPCGLRDRGTLIQAVGALRRLHDQEPPRDGSIPPSPAAGTMGSWRAILRTLQVVLRHRARAGRSETPLDAALTNVALGLRPTIERFVATYESGVSVASELVICHGDPRTHNLVRTGDGLGLLDWESACLRDRVSDVAWLLELAGLPDEADEVAVTAYAADRPDIDPAALFASLSVRRRLYRLLWPLRMLAEHLESGREHRFEIIWRLGRGLRAWPELAGPWAGIRAADLARALPSASASPALGSTKPISGTARSCPTRR